ncbi:ATP-binding cassette domain-containing protein [Burkholderiaceae bacterium FT117]|uniref:ABC transporter ATP-binding protein n=1 Tax=Zeimonas sediminis TaxID=2944268 RepID=UPI002342E5B2|nr:ATP-binding cassette domain-containing protein [Zeimonas sediminis]MCM5571838.1 ATP-binding cassette domain-containing protein [Zeimonas sediminis]
MSAAPVIELRGIGTRFGRQVVHDGLDLSIGAGELVAIIGGSGTGKSVLLREIVGLHRPDAGSVRLLGVDVWQASEPELAAVRRRFGMMFQDGALFSSLTVAANVAVPLRESGLVPESMIEPLVALRLAQAGLPPDAGAKMPSQLSGGMRKRAAIARALALEPEVLFLDEPTSGLDPITARAFDRLLESLCEDLGITVVVVTHDLDTLTTIARRIVVLGGGRVAGDGTLEEVSASDDPWIREYFSSRKMPAGEESDGR